MSAADELREMTVSWQTGKFWIDTISIYHPLISQTYYLAKLPYDITATLEDTDIVTFLASQFEPQMNSTKDDLNQDFAFTFADVDNTLDNELNLIPLNDETPIEITYRGYISDNLLYPAIVYYLNVTEVARRKGAFTISCGVSQMNWQKTGLYYDLETFPMLKGL